MKDRLSRIAAAAAALLACAELAAAQDFGFGAEPAGGGAAVPAGVRLGGAVEFGYAAFPAEIDALGDLDVGRLVSGRLFLSASGSKADASVKLRLNDSVFADMAGGDFWACVDEAKLGFSAGPATVEGGLMKLAWGKADSQGPLDVTNPLDLRDLTVVDQMDRKIAAPMLRASLALGESAKVEGLFIPWFRGYRIATSGRWMPDQVDELATAISTINYAYTYYGYPSSPFADASAFTYDELLDAADYSSLEHFQAGARATASLGGVDLGAQYFYGYLFAPAVVFAGSPLPSSVELVYNRYHQAGLDAAAVLAGFNLRAELAANITDDLAGDDPAVYNPALAFSLGFDRDLVAGINLNLQWAGTYRLADDQVDDSAASYDIEADTDAFASKLTAVLSQSLFKDALSWELCALYGVSDEDWLVMPKLTWKVGEASVIGQAGIFGGDNDGELGQYDDASWLRLSMRCEF